MTGTQDHWAAGTLQDPSILVGVSPSELQAWGPRNAFLEHSWVMDYGGWGLDSSLPVLGQCEHRNSHPGLTTGQPQLT